MWTRATCTGSLSSGSTAGSRDAVELAARGRRAAELDRRVAADEVQVVLELAQAREHRLDVLPLPGPALAAVLEDQAGAKPLDQGEELAQDRGLRALRVDLDEVAAIEAVLRLEGPGANGAHQDGLAGSVPGDEARDPLLECPAGEAVQGLPPVRAPQSGLDDLDLLQAVQRDVAPEPGAD